METALALRAYPGKDVQRPGQPPSGAIDPASRTLLVELKVPNADAA